VSEYITHDNCHYSSLSKSHVICRITPLHMEEDKFEIYKCFHCGLLQLCGCPTMMRIQYSRSLTLSRWSRLLTSATGSSKLVRASLWLNQMPCHWPQQASRLSVVLFIWGQIAILYIICSTHYYTDNSCSPSNRPGLFLN